MGQFAVSLHGDDVCFDLRPTTSERSAGDSESCFKNSALDLESCGNQLSLPVKYASLISQMKERNRISFFEARKQFASHLVSCWADVFVT
jgi:hypothetical protein